VRISCYSSGELIVPEEELKKEAENPLVKVVKKAILKIYDVLEIACMEVQRQKQEGSIGIGTSINLPGFPITALMTMIFDIVTSYVVNKGQAYLKSAGARAVFDGII